MRGQFQDRGDAKHESNEQDVVQGDEPDREPLGRGGSEGRELNHEAEHGEGHEIIHKSDGNNGPSQPRVQEVQVEEDSHADRKGRDGHGGAEEQGLRERQAQRGGEAVPQGEREKELDDGDDHASFLERLSQTLAPEFDSREQHENEDAEIGDDVQRLSERSRWIRIDEAEDHGS